MLTPTEYIAKVNLDGPNMFPQCHKQGIEISMVKGLQLMKVVSDA